MTLTEQEYKIIEQMVEQHRAAAAREAETADRLAAAIEANRRMELSDIAPKVKRTAKKSTKKPSGRLAKLRKELDQSGEE